MYSVLVACPDATLLGNIRKYVPTVNPDIRIVPAADRASALEALSADPQIEAVVCEHSKRMDAFSLYDAICRNPSWTRSFILTTAEKDMSIAVRALEYRMDALVPRASGTFSFYVDLAQRMVLACERRRASAARDLDDRRKDAVIRLASLRDHPFSEVLSYALESSVDLTGSQIGYVATYSSSTRKLKIIAWSIKAMGLCRMINRPMEYDFDTAGLWAEPIRLMKTVIVDDYELEHVYRKNGLPAGHVQLKKLLMVPIVLNGMPVATAGVGNKEGDYDDEDADQLKMLMTSLISIYQDNLFKDESRDRESLLGAILNTSPYGIIYLDREMGIRACSRSASLMLGIGERTGLTGNLKDVAGSELASAVVYAVAEAYEDNESRSTYVRAGETARKSDYTVSVDLMMDTEGRAEGCLVSIIDLVGMASAGAPDPGFEKRMRMIAGYLKDTICEARDSDDPALLDDTVAYLDAVKRIGSAPPEWQRVGSCIPVDAGGLEIDADIGPVNVLADRTLPDAFAAMAGYSVRTGAEKAEVGVSVKDGVLRITYTDDGEGIPGSMKPIVSAGGTGLGLWAETLHDVLAASGFEAVENGEYGKGVRIEISVPADRFFIGRMQDGGARGEARRASGDRAPEENRRRLLP